MCSRGSAPKVHTRLCDVVELYPPNSVHARPRFPSENFPPTVLTTNILKRSATAVWNGSLTEGTGSLTSASGILHSTQYSFGSRFESSPGINPEELIAGALAGCYTMALSGSLSDAGYPPDRLEVTVEVIVENSTAQGWTITGCHLAVNARVLTIDAERFAEVAERAKSCPVSRALNVTITLEAKLA